jgi:uncharacterized membrane protein YeaQ/YmgE (transglycosylase-associated protein family)
MFGVLGWMLFGLLVGIIAKLVMPGRDPGGILVTMLLGIAGALIGGYLGQGMGLYHQGDSAGIIMSVIGAVLLLFVFRKLRPAPHL